MFINCNEKAYSIIRGKIVCVRHFKILKMDNKERRREKLDIPNSFDLLPRTKESFKWELEKKKEEKW